MFQQDADRGLGTACVEVADRSVGTAVAESPTDPLGGVDQLGPVTATIGGGQPLDSVVQGCRDHYGLSRCDGVRDLWWQPKVTDVRALVFDPNGTITI